MVFDSKDLTYLQRCYHFTPRQMDVVKCICNGLENDEIAKKLKIRYNTVSAHLWNICRRVGVKGKFGLAIAFIEAVKKRKN